MRLRFSIFFYAEHVLFFFCGGSRVSRYENPWPRTYFKKLSRFWHDVFQFKLTTRVYKTRFPIIISKIIMCTRYPQSFCKLNVDFWLNFLSSLSRVFTDYNKKKQVGYIIIRDPQKIHSRNFKIDGRRVLVSASLGVYIIILYRPYTHRNY